MSDDELTPARAAPQRRRTQAERSSSMRKRICEATLDALVEVGYERISTTLVAEKARVSRGALTHHFPVRNDLLVAAYQYLVDRWGEVVPFVEGADDDRLGISELIDALWENVFSTKHYIASIELMLAARQDGELGSALRDVMTGWIRRRDSRALRLMGSSIDNREDTLFLQLLLSVLRGIAIHQSFDNDRDVVPRLIALWKEIARQARIGDPPREGRP